MILGFGEIMMRLSPSNDVMLKEATKFEANYGGSEGNVMIGLSSLGNQTRFVTRLPKTSLGEAVLYHLNKYKVDTSFIINKGENLGLYFFEKGVGLRGGKVIYNRKNSEITKVTEKDFDYDKIFENVTLFHVSGISLALSKTCYQTVLEFCKQAKKRNVKISFDFNYRKTLWGIDEAKLAYKTILPYVDICFGNVFDINNFADINDINECKVINDFLTKYNITYLFNTTRVMVSSSFNKLSGSAFYLEDKKIKKIITPVYECEILDRIGAGDAFDAGVLNSLIKEFNNPEKALNDGIQCDVLKHSIRGDVFTFTYLELKNIFTNDNKDIKR